jgi:tRNA A-37 threonylcarbamoyl transferase component Bud32
MSLAGKRPVVVPFAVLDCGAGRKFFVKAYSSHVRLGYEKGRAVYEAAQRSDLFRSPRPLELVESCGLIVWEYIESTISFRDYLVRLLTARADNKLLRLKLMRRVGETIATVHEALATVGSNREFWPIREIQSNTEAVNRYTTEQLHSTALKPVHGDFSAVNLFCIENGDADGTLVVLDFTPNEYLFAKVSPDVKCSLYIDCAQFYYSLRCNRSFYAFVKDEVDDYLTEILKGYERVSGIPLDRSTVLACSAEIAKRHQFYLDKTKAPWSVAVVAWIAMNMPAVIRYVLDRNFRLRSARKLFIAAEAALEVPDL